MGCTYNFYVRLDDFAQDDHVGFGIWRTHLLTSWVEMDCNWPWFLGQPCAQGINMSCLDEIGSEVVQSQWNNPPRYSTARSKLPETKRWKDMEDIFFFDGGWVTSAAISESSQDMSENWTGISTKILGQRLLNDSVLRSGARYQDLASWREEHCSCFVNHQLKKHEWCECEGLKQDTTWPWFGLGYAKNTLPSLFMHQPSSYFGRKMKLQDQES